jgi:hypothetical protein
MTDMDKEILNWINYKPVIKLIPTHSCSNSVPVHHSQNFNCTISNKAHTGGGGGGDDDK